MENLFLDVIRCLKEILKAIYKDIISQLYEK